VTSRLLERKVTSQLPVTTMNLSLIAKIESLLFVANSPLTIKQIAKLVDSEPAKVEGVLGDLEEGYGGEDSGLQIVRRGQDVILGTKSEVGSLVGKFLKEQVRGELTRPQLEALTIVAYRGPVTKTELNMIRGVNCALILRNLLIRGLIDEKQDKKLHVSVYEVSVDFLRFLGVQSVDELPQYEELRKHADLESVLEDH